MLYYILIRSLHISLCFEFSKFPPFFPFHIYSFKAHTISLCIAQVGRRRVRITLIVWQLNAQFGVCWWTVVYVGAWGPATREVVLLTHGSLVDDGSWA